MVEEQRQREGKEREGREQERKRGREEEGEKKTGEEECTYMYIQIVKFFSFSSGHTHF